MPTDGDPSTTAGARDLGMIVAAHRRIALAGAAVGSGGLAASALWLAFHGGGTRVDRVVPIGVILGAGLLALALGGGLGAPLSARSPGWLAVASAIALAILAALSLTWTESPTLTVDGTVFSTLAVLVLFCSFVLLRGPAAASTGVAVLIAVPCAIALVIEWHLLAGDRDLLFPYSRLSYPIDYGGGAAALAFIGAPAAVAMASLARVSAVARAALAGAAGLMIATGSLALSRSATLALLLSLAVVFVLARSRIPVLLMIVVQAVAFAAAWPLLLWPDPGVTTERGVGVLVAAAVSTGAALVALSVQPFVVRGWSRRRVRLACLAAAGFLVVATAVANAPALSHAFSDFRKPPVVSSSGVSERQRLFNTQSRFTTTRSNRWEYWTVALRTWRAHPFAGIGAGSFAIPWYRERSILEGTTDPHGWPFKLAAEQGALGVGLFLVTVAALVAAALACRRRGGSHAVVGAAAAGSTAYFLLHGGTDWLYSMGSVLVLGMTAAGALLGAAVDAPRRLGTLRFHAGVGAVAVLALALFLPVWISLRYQARAERQPDPGTAASSLRAARRWNPLSIESFQIQAAIEAGAGRSAAAEVELRRAIRAEPDRWEPWAQLAALRAQRGDSAGAAAAGRRARTLNPLEPSLSGY